MQTLMTVFSILFYYKDKDQHNTYIGQIISNKHQCKNVLNRITQMLSYLKKHSEEDDGDGGGDEELLADDFVRKSEGQGK